MSRVFPIPRVELTSTELEWSSEALRAERARLIGEILELDPPEGGRRAHFLDSLHERTTSRAIAMGGQAQARLVGRVFVINERLRELGVDPQLR